MFRGLRSFKRNMVSELLLVCVPKPENCLQKHGFRIATGSCSKVSDPLTDTWFQNCNWFVFRSLRTVYRNMVSELQPDRVPKPQNFLQKYTSRVFKCLPNIHYIKHTRRKSPRHCFRFVDFRKWREAPPEIQGTFSCTDNEIVKPQGIATHE